MPAHFIRVFTGGAWRRHVSFQGRASRSTVLSSLLSYGAIMLFFALFILLPVQLALAAMKVDFRIIMDLVAWMAWAVWAPFAVSLASLLVRRLHDLGHSGWWLLLNIGLGLAAQTVMDMRIAPQIAQAVVFGYLLVLMPASFYVYFWPGAHGANRYGPPPAPETWTPRSQPQTTNPKAALDETLRNERAQLEEARRRLAR